MTGQPRPNAPRRPIYLDYQATTPLDERVLEAMMPYLTEKFGNPHSRSHLFGWEAEEAVERAREEIAALIGADAREIVFTSGATESNNLAIKGAALFQRRLGERAARDRIVTVATEHKCVLETCAALEAQGFAVTYLPVGPGGLVDLDRLAEAVDERTLLVSVMAVNNEIGVIQPLAEIGALCRERGAYFHTDAAQGVGKIPLDVEAMNIDLLSVSGHKLYGPKGIGALYVRRRPRVRLEPLISGGGQERGLRSGTLPTPLCVGLGKACALAREEMETEAARLAALRDRFHGRVEKALGDVHINGDHERRIPGNLNVSLGGVDGDAVMRALDGVAVSSGSACSSASLEPSYVLRALGLSEERARASLRVGFGRFTTADEVDRAAERLIETVARLRRETAAPARTAGA